MSDRPIGPGDLVMLLWPSNEKMQEFSGQIRTVADKCDVWPDSWNVDPPTICRNGLPASWKTIHLKRIDPLSELESVKKADEVKA